MPADNTKPMRDRLDQWRGKRLPEDDWVPVTQLLARLRAYDFSPDVRQSGVVRMGEVYGQIYIKRIDRHEAFEWRVWQGEKWGRRVQVSSGRDRVLEEATTDMLAAIARAQIESRVKAVTWA